MVSAGDTSSPDPPGPTPEGTGMTEGFRPQSTPPGCQEPGIDPASERGWQESFSENTTPEE